MADPVAKMTAARRTLPIPTDGSHFTLETLHPGLILHRVHASKYGPVQFNPGPYGDARFSPIVNPAGAQIATMYAGTTQECALMETVFRSVPYEPGYKTIDKVKFQDQIYSTVTLAQPFHLVDLRAIALRKVGLTREELIDTEMDRYPDTRKIAEAIYALCPDAQGLYWVSRQDDSARAVVLFGDRIPSDALSPGASSLSLLRDHATHAAVLDLADKLGVYIV
jgi:hypothetical protein